MTERQHQDAAKSIVEGFQQAIGVSVLNVAAWLGPAAAAWWIWDAILTSTGAPESPLLWFDHLARDAGWSAPWAVETHKWLTARPELGWPLILLAAFTASLRTAEVRTVTCAALLLTLSLRTVPSVAASFLLITFLLCIAAYATDKAEEASTRQSEHQHYAIFEISFTRWVTGPLSTLVFSVAFPALLLYWAIKNYRAPSYSLPTHGWDLARAANDLGDGPLGAMSTRKVATFVAQALVVASGDDQSEKHLALEALRHRRDSGA